MASSSSSSSSLVTNTQEKFEVFLSFRGVDTRYGFISHLHDALLRGNIVTFIDEKELQGGDEVEQSLLDAIEKSTISVVTFSKDYASSGWCLQELEHMLECNKLYKQTILPVFYHVNPTDVEYQTGTYEEALRKLKDSYSEQKAEKWRENEPKWRAAMAKAAKICGFSTNKIRNEANLVKEIVEYILKILNRMPPSVNKDFVVGVQSSIAEIEPLLHNRLEEKLGIIGIWGMGGIGKTTIALAIYDRIKNQFQNDFFADVRKNSVNPDFTKQKLYQKKVIIVLDDVTSVEQIEALIGDFTSFLGLGSQIIITTRDKGVLQSYNVPIENIYEVKGLSHPEALQLFNWWAFEPNEPTSSYDSMSDWIVEYTKGVPLALKNWGKFLRKHKSVENWESAIKKYQTFPFEEIQEVLKLSYNELDVIQKGIFLDIACFFKRENKHFVINFLLAHNFTPQIELGYLINKCLISITSDEKILVNDLLQVMAWEIVRRESRDLAKRSRLWYHDDVKGVLRKNTGTTKVEGICLDMSKITREISLGPDGFGQMHNLRIFKLYNPSGGENINKVLISRDLKFTFTDLRYLCWHGCPLKSLQLTFQSESLAALEMPHSNLDQLWTGNEHFDNLKYINLSYSKHLVRIPEFSLFPNLERLILEGCTGLLEISSIEHLKKLLHLELRYCEKLLSLPELPISLQSIDAHSCTLLEASSGLSILCPTKKSVRVDFSNCFKLNQNALKGFIKVVLEKIERPPVTSSCCFRTRACICFPGTDIPECFTDQSTGSSIAFKLPQGLSNKKFLSFAVSAIVELRKYHNEGQGLEVGYECRDDTVVVYNGTLMSWECGTGPRFDSDHVFLGYDFLVYDAKTRNNNGEMTLQFYVKDLNSKHLDACEVKKCGFRSLHHQEEVTVDHGEEQDEPEPPCKRRKFSNQFEGESSIRLHAG